MPCMYMHMCHSVSVCVTVRLVAALIYFIMQQQLQIVLCIDFLVCIRFEAIKFSFAGSASQKSCVITLIELTSSYCYNCCSCDAASARPATCGGRVGYCQQQQLRL